MSARGCSSVGIIGGGIQGVCISLCLIKKGFNPCIKNNDGVTPIEIAQSVCPKFKITDWDIDWDISTAMS